MVADDLIQNCSRCGAEITWLELWLQLAGVYLQAILHIPYELWRMERVIRSYALHHQYSRAALTIVPDPELNEDTEYLLWYRHHWYLRQTLTSE